MPIPPFFIGLFKMAATTFASTAASTAAATAATRFADAATRFVEELMAEDAEIPKALLKRWQQRLDELHGELEETKTELEKERQKRKRQIVVAGVLCLILGGLVGGSVTWYALQPGQSSEQILSLEELEKYERARDAGLQALLEAMNDSLSKFGDILLENNNQLSEELKKTKHQLSEELKKTKQEADEYRRNRNNERLQKEVSQLQAEIDQLQEDKHTNEQEIRRLSVAIDSISVDRDRLIGTNQDIKNKLNEIREALNAVHRIQKSVRLLVGTESLLKSNGFLETSRGATLRKQYKLVEKIEGDDSRVKIVPLNQQLHLTIDSVPGALVGRSGKLDLKALVGSHGKLKEGRDCKVDKSKGATIITFVNRVLEGTDVLAVVEVED